MSAPLRLLVAEDHTIVREGLVALLSSQPHIQVVAQVADGRSAVAEAQRLRPDVVLLDLAMPQLNGVDATRQLCDALPDVRVLILSMHAGEEYVRPAVRAGAAGYLLKGSGLSDLVTAIETVARGERFFSPRVAQLLEAEGSPRVEAVAGQPLTGREREVLQLVGEGHSSAEIAHRLGLSLKTIEGHRGRIMTKLAAGNVADLVRYAVRLGLVDVNS